MSLFDSASLVVTPNGYKEDKLYSIKPTDGSGDLVVTRATTATRVNSAGLIEEVPYNLIQYSEQFDNGTWTKISSSITANSVTAPNGTLTADKFESTSAGVPEILQTTTNSNTKTISFYAKEGNVSTIALWVGSEVKFNLSTGVVISGAGTIESVGNGWYRCVVANTTFPHFNGYFISTASGQFVYIWGAQIVNGTSAKEYFPTTDRLNVPRLDYTNSSCPSILVEPQRTNLVLRSQEFNTVWIPSAGSPINQNTTISPDGTQNADTYSETGSGNYLFQSAGTISGTYTISVFAKKGSSTFIGLGLVGGGFSSGMSVQFNFDTQTFQTPINYSNFTGISAKSENYGNGWYRLTLTGTTAILSSYFFVLGSLVGSSYTANSIIYGAQLEAGSYATSYIPTVASSVTRNADVISKTGISSLIGQTEGTLFVDVNYKAESIVKIYLNLGTSTSNYIAIGTKANNKIGMEVLNSGVQVNAESTSTYSTNQRLKIAMTYKLNDFKLYVNGILQATDTSGTVPAKAEIYLGSYGNGTQQAMDGINSAQLYKTALSDTECINLTTI